MALIRPAAENDLPELCRIWLLAEGAATDVLTASRGRVLPLHRHELRTGRLLVAEEAGAVVGFAASLPRQDVVFLADLFVLPRYQAMGIGGQLLQDLFSGAAAARYTCASEDPRAQRLYLRHGMIPRFSICYLTARDPHPLDPVGCTPHPTAVDKELVAADAAWYGRERPEDLGYYLSLGAQAWWILRADERVGYALICPATPWNPYGDAIRVGPVVMADPELAHAGVAVALGVALECPPKRIRFYVPAHNPAFEAMTAAGFEVQQTDTFMATPPDPIDFARIITTADVV